MIRNGVKPIKYRDHRTYDFQKTFGQAVLDYSEFTLDAGLTMRDQNAEGLPQGCTGMTQTDCATDQDKLVYEPLFTYKWTLFMEDSPMGSPCSVMASLKSTTVYGLQEKGKEGEELTHRRAPYFIIKRLGDHFDGIVSAMRLKNISVSVGTPWPSDLERTGKDGIVHIYDWPTEFTSGHNYKICGIKHINGEPYLRVKSWQGAHFGDKGWCYFDRKTTNRLLGYEGAGAFANVKAEKSDIRLVSMTIIQTIISYLYRLLAIVRKQKPTPPVTEEHYVPPVEKPKEVVHSTAWQGGDINDRRMMFQLVQGLCNEENVTPEMAAEIQAVVWAESGHNQWCENINKDGTGDYGIAQLNSYWYLAPNKMTPEDAKNDPARCIKIMIRSFKAGRADDWIARRNGGYKVFLGKKL